MKAIIEEVHSTLDFSFKALKNVCSRKSPFGFLCLAALIDYLSKLAYGGNLKDWERYIKFITEFFPLKYRNFQYKTGKQDLPQQIYYVLRNGMVHSFTLIPDEKGRKYGGRSNSIILCHRREAKRDRLIHLGNYRNRHGRFDDAALFIMEDFFEDTKIAAYKLIKKACLNPSLRKEIQAWYIKYPPITGGFKISLIQ
jgi:hypothetical protein